MKQTEHFPGDFPKNPENSFEKNRDSAMPRKSRRTAGGVIAILLILTGVAALLAGLGLVGYNIFEDRTAGGQIAPVISILRQRAGENAGQGGEDQSGEDGTSDLTVIPDYILNPGMDLPTVEIDGHLYVGTVTVPAIDLELPVIDHWSEKDKKLLKIAPCRYVGTPYQKNMIIAGHNYTTHFGRLKNLQPGDAVTFTDVDGNVFRYHVVKLETLPGTAVAEMQSGGYDFTLFTCTIGGVSRVTVRCMADEEAP